MLIKNYTIVAIPDVENLNDYTQDDCITKHDIIVERIIATSYIKALERFKAVLRDMFYYHQIRFPVEKHNFLKVTPKSKTLNQQFSIRQHYWRSIKVAATNHNRLVLRERYSAITHIAKAKINKKEIEQKLGSLDNDNLRDIYDNARSNSFSLLRAMAFNTNPYTAWLIHDIGDAFHNNPITNESIMSDLLFYEEWIYTIKELNIHYDFHHISDHTISEIMANLK